MLTCPQCGETSSFLANYCRRCGSNIKSYDPDLTSVLTQSLDSKNAPFFPARGERVKSLEYLFCTIELSMEVHTLSHVPDISKFPLYEDEEKQAILDCLNYREPFDFSLIPIDKVNTALQELAEGFSNQREYPSAPRILQSPWIHDELGLSGFFFITNLSLRFRYNLTSFHDDKKLVLQTVTDAIKDLYDWKGFKIIAKCSFGVDTPLTL